MLGYRRRGGESLGESGGWVQRENFREREFRETSRVFPLSAVAGVANDLQRS